jgi:hypothetical protein
VPAISQVVKNQKTIAVSAIAIAAVTAVFAATPLIVAYVQSHDAQAIGWGGGFRFHRHFGFGFNRFGGFGGCGGGCCC